MPTYAAIRRIRGREIVENANVTWDGLAPTGFSNHHLIPIASIPTDARTVGAYRKDATWYDANNKRLFVRGGKLMKQTVLG